MTPRAPEALAAQVLEQCGNCGYCRDILADLPCLLFTRLFQLDDRMKAGGAVAPDELKKLVDLCNMCGLCACPTIRADIRNAKDAFVARDGLPPALRLLEDVRLVGKVCGLFPRLANALLNAGPVAGLLKRLGGIHPDRKMPSIPAQAFPAWARARGLDRRRPSSGRKVAYFAGCTAQFLFPEVAKATVEVLDRNGITVFMPEQKCCGMPSLIEGDRPFTFAVAGFNLDSLDAAVAEGYDIVCSCPTCGYMLKCVCPDGAYLSQEYRAYLRQSLAQAGGDLTRLREIILEDETHPAGARTPAAPRQRPPLPLDFILAGTLRDQGYFASMDGLKRIRVASHTYDLAEYLRLLDGEGRFNRRLGPVPGRTAYFPPCHLKEQSIGQPWAELLALIPGFAMDSISGPYDCCGQGGIMGFKAEFHDASLAMGKPLHDKIVALAPERLTTDCLSCRMQFNQTLAMEAVHPVEILRDSYRSAAPDPSGGSTASGTQGDGPP